MPILILKQYFPRSRLVTIAFVDSLAQAVQKLESDEARLFYLEQDDLDRTDSKPILSLIAEMERDGNFIDIYSLIENMMEEKSGD